MYPFYNPERFGQLTNIQQKLRKLLEQIFLDLYRRTDLGISVKNATVSFRNKGKQARTIVVSRIIHKFFELSEGITDLGELEN